MVSRPLGVIVWESKSWLRQIGTLDGSALEKVLPRLIGVTVIATVITVLHEAYGVFPTSLTPLPFSLIAVALGIFLGFRNNTSYDRFWEGRKLWGALVNTTRSITRQTLTLIAPDQDDEVDDVQVLRIEIVHRVIAYVHVFRQHLRDEDALDEVAALLPAADIQALRNELNRPIAILQRLSERIRTAYDRGWIHPMHLPTLEASLTALTDIQGGCERIKSTPIPGSYTILIHRIVAIYTFALPFGIVDTVGYYTPVVVMMIAYAFLGLDSVGDEIEDPFGKDLNDLPLSAISRMIEVNLRQRLHEEALPELLSPRDGVLQ